MTKTCIKCGLEKPLSEYFKHSAAGGLRNDCKACNYARATKWRNDNRARVNTTRLDAERRRLYGVSREIVDQMLADQGGKCAVCRKPFHRTPHVDHHHETMKVRGLLCARCNIGVGFLDAAGWLPRAQAYITGGTETQV